MEANRDDTQTENLYSRLSLLRFDKNDENAVDEIVVIAFGSGDKFYVCWKDAIGHFSQDSNGLPASLHSWLFPDNGTTRDFPSLQVILGHGEEFYASDKDGNISHTDPGPKARVDSFSRPASIILDPNRASVDMDYETQSMVPNPKPRKMHSSNYLTDVTSFPPPRRRRTVIGSRERPRSIISSTRSRSTSYSWESTDSQDSSLTSPSTTTSQCSCGNAHGPLKSYQTPTYVDAAVQTVAEPNAGSLEFEDMASIAISTNLIGHMQNYFRSQEYQLGNFFGAGRLP